MVRTLGGCGATVFEAVDDALGRRAALTLLGPPLARTTFFKRLRRNAQAVSNVVHPNLVATYDVGEADGHVYVATEYVDGVGLAERLREGPLPWPEATRIVREVTAALEAAHRAGFVHRALQPSAILLTAAGGVKLAELGQVEPLDSERRPCGVILGAPACLSPSSAWAARSTHGATSTAWERSSSPWSAGGTRSTAGRSRSCSPNRSASSPSTRASTRPTCRRRSPA